MLVGSKWIVGIQGKQAAADYWVLAYHCEVQDNTCITWTYLILSVTLLATKKVLIELTKLVFNHVHKSLVVFRKEEWMDGDTWIELGIPQRVAYFNFLISIVIVFSVSQLPLPEAQSNDTSTAPSTLCDMSTRREK